MDDITIVEECVVSVEEIKEEVCDACENSECNMLGNSSDEVKAPVAVILQPQMEREEGRGEQEVQNSTFESPVAEQNDSEEEELKPVAAVYLKTEVEVDEETEEQEDPLAGPNAHMERETRYQFAGSPDDLWNDESSSRNNDGPLSSTHQHLQCPVCKENWSCKRQLDLHMGTHTGKMPFECVVCGKLFAQKSSCMRHVQIHTGNTPLQCSICANRRFPRGSNFIFQVLITGDKSIQCTICQKPFPSKHKLNKHMRVHMEEGRQLENVSG